MWVTPEINAATAFVAAWLPGSEGAGIADVLIRNPSGAINFDFAGKLSFSWPRTATQTKVNRGDNNYDPLFPYGYGLTYKDNGNLPQLPETSGLDGYEETSSNALFALGQPMAPWSLQTTDISSPDAHNQPNTLTVRTVDRAAQEDARQFVWSSEEPARIALTGPATDYTAAVHYGATLVIQYRVDTLPKGPVTLFVECGNGCGAELDLTQLLADTPIGDWTQADITLSSLVEAGADLSQLTTLGIKTAGPYSMSLSDIRQKFTDE